MRFLLPNEHDNAVIRRLSTASLGSLPVDQFSRLLRKDGRGDDRLRALASPRLASPAEARNLAPRYLFELDGPGGGPITLGVGEDRVTATRARGAGPGPTLPLMVETFIRLVWGRLDLHRAWARGDVRVDVPGEEILALGALFPGH